MGKNHVHHVTLLDIQDLLAEYVMIYEGKPGSLFLFFTSSVQN